MQVTLLQCPANNPDSPPYAFALLNAALKQQGHEPHVFDLNIALYHQAKSVSEDNAWATGHSQESPIEYWIDEAFSRRNLDAHEGFIDDYLDRVLEVASPLIGFSFPNQFSTNVSRRYALFENVNVTIEFKDILGRKISTSNTGKQTEGIKEFIWNGKSDSGDLLPEGVYFYSIRAGEQVFDGKIIKQ